MSDSSSEEQASDTDADTESESDLQYLTIARTSPEVEDLDDEDKAKILENRASLGSETGCMMRFAPLRYGGLEPSDIEDLVDTSYPVPRSALDSLPAHIEAKLDDQDYVQFFARYDRENSEFHDIRLRRDQTDAIDEMMELVSRFNIGPIIAFDYVVAESHDEYSPETIATARNVETRTVEGNIDKVRSILFENNDMTSQSDLES